jgi:signal transduction histidine kinase
MTDLAVAHPRTRGFPPAFLGYVLVLCLAVAVLVPSALRAFTASPWDALFLTALMVATSLLTVPVVPAFDVDEQLDGPVAVAASVLLPPSLAVLVVFLGFTNHRELRLAVPPWLSLFNRGQAGLSAGLAGVSARPLLGVFGGGEPTVLGQVVATVVAVAVHNAANILLLGVGEVLRHRSTFRESLAYQSVPAPGSRLDVLLVSLLAVPIVVVYREYEALAVLLLGFPLGLGYSAIRSARESSERAEELSLQVRELEMLNDLGKELLAEHDLQRVVDVTRRALQRALGTDAVVVDLTGDVPGDLQAFKVPGAEPAVIGAPPGLSGGSAAAVDAVAGLLGMSLQRVELAEELAEVQRARVALSGRILEEGTRERSRIALEIHDDVLPYLAAAEIQADNIRSALRRAETERAEDLAAVTQDAVSGGIGRLRDVLAQLRNQIIVPGSLAGGLREALDDLKLVHGVETDLVAPQNLESLPLAVEILLLETVRGCLANVARHAQAERVKVELEYTHSGISLAICDDGRGFDPRAIREGSHGLSLLAQRVDLARGSFVVTSAVGEGTRVHVEVPL